MSEPVKDFLMETGELSLNDIVGQDIAIKELQNLVNYIRNKPIYAEWGVSAPKGILLDGPPGCGKTASIRALAKELDGEVILAELRYVDLASKWVDAPIESLREFFANIEEVSKDKHVILFIDEIDSMIPDRSKDAHETSKKRVNVFLEWMDGGLSKRTNNVTMIGATNLIDDLDPAAKRAGRFDKTILFKELTGDDIVKGIQIHLSKKKIQKNKIGKIDFKSVAKNFSSKKNRLTGSDIPELINRVLTKKVNEQMLFASKPLLDIVVKDGVKPLDTQSIIDGLDEYILYKNSLLKEKTKQMGFVCD